MKIVSEKIRASAKGEKCTVRQPDCCNFNTETTVFAHLPVGQRGTAIKTPDLFGVYACSNCHDAIDRRSKGTKIAPADLLRALTETQMRLVEKGLLLIPDTITAQSRAAPRAHAAALPPPKKRSADSPTARPSKCLPPRFT
jgi:hypothetical protein